MFFAFCFYVLSMSTNVRFCFLFCSGPKPVTSGGPPPPPPPPPPGLFSDAKAEDKGETKAINALFADINKGEDVTRGKEGPRLHPG